MVIVRTNAALLGLGDVILNDYDVKAGLASSLLTVNDIFWKTAYDTERKICSIVTSINQQNVDSVRGNLVVG